MPPFMNIYYWHNSYLYKRKMTHFLLVWEIDRLIDKLDELGVVMEESTGLTSNQQTSKLPKKKREKKNRNER